MFSCSIDIFGHCLGVTTDLLNRSHLLFSFNVHLGLCIWQIYVFYFIQTLHLTLHSSYYIVYLHFKFVFFMILVWVLINHLMLFSHLLYFYCSLFLVFSVLYAFSVICQGNIFSFHLSTFIYYNFFFLTWIYCIWRYFYPNKLTFNSSYYSIY